MSQFVYVTDLDGTLLQSDQTLSAHTVEALNYFLAEEGVFTFATARGFISAMSVVEQIAWKHPMILYNGALLYDPTDHRVVDGYWLDSGIANAVIDIGKKHSFTPFLFMLDTNDRETVWHEPLTRTGMLAFVQSRKNDPRFQEMEHLICPLDHRTLAVTFIGLYDELKRIKDDMDRLLGDQIHTHLLKDYYIEDHYFLEFSHPKANKKEGLKLWANHMKVQLKDIVVFGDHLNDIGLFEAGGTKIAVQNAQETILKLADLIIESNDQDGVANYLLKKKASSEMRVKP